MKTALTTRQMKADELRGPSDAQFEINGFDSERQEEFARRFLKDDEDVQSFLVYLEQHNLKELAEIPLLLLILCLLWQEKDREGVPTSRANIFFRFIQTFFDHLFEKNSDAMPMRKEDDYTDELCKLGSLAFDALLQNCLYFLLSKLPDRDLIKKLIDVGLFNILNISNLNRDQGVFFLHKSLQEYLAAWFLNEELLSTKNQNTPSLSKVDSIKKILNMEEVFPFACELSGEAASEIIRHFGVVAEKEGLTDYNFMEIPSEEDLSGEQRNLLTLCGRCFSCCPADKRRELFPAFLSSVRGVLLINSSQLHIIANERLLTTTSQFKFIFFTEENRKHSEEDYYSDLITVVEDLNAVVVSCSGEKKASEFLKKHKFRPVHEFFLKKEQNTNLYFARIVKNISGSLPLPTEMLKELLAATKSTTTKNRKRNGVESNKEQNTTGLRLTKNCDSNSYSNHCLSMVRDIYAFDVGRSVLEIVSDVLSLVTAPRRIRVFGADGCDADLAETLVKKITFTNRLKELELININLTANAAAIIAESLYKVPNLSLLGLSFNPLLGEGVSFITENLSCVPDLKTLGLEDVIMTRKQVDDLTTAVHRNKIIDLSSSYHDFRRNLLPEHEWPTEEYWKREYPSLFPDSSFKPEDKQRQHDPWLHHHASESGGPSMSSEIARSARPLPTLSNTRKVSRTTLGSMGAKQLPEDANVDDDDHEDSNDAGDDMCDVDNDNNDDNGGGDGGDEDDNEDDVGNVGSQDITEEQELPQQFHELQLEGQEEHLEEQNQNKTKIHEEIVTSEGTYWPLKQKGVHLMFPANAVSEPTTIVVHKWKCSACSPPLQDHEAIVSNVIEISTINRQALEFNAEVKLFLSHSAPDLKGYEIVIKRQIDQESNEWEDVDGTEVLRGLSDIGGGCPSSNDIPDFFFPVAQAGITKCSTYTVVCRLKSSPLYTITSTGGNFSHPDYPGVTVTIPENAVAPEAKFPLRLTVQEIPNEEFEGQDVFLGPVLRIVRSQVHFLKPVTIQLPVSLRDEREGIPDPLTCRVRVFFLRTNGEHKEWIEITDDLVNPASFEGTFVTFQVKRFSGYTCVLDGRKENSSDAGCQCDLSRHTSNPPIRAYFFTYFCPDVEEILVLICCPNHLRPEVINELERKNINTKDVSSKEKMIPGDDRAFVFLSGGIEPFCAEEMEDLYLMFDSDSLSKTELHVRFVSNKGLARVEFYSTPKPSRGTFLCKLHLKVPSLSADRTASVEVTRQPGIPRDLKDGNPSYPELEGLSEKLPDHWEKLGRRLNFDDAKLKGYHKDNEEVAKKVYAMLKAWKEREGSDATYRVLYKALCDIYRKDLAQDLCCH